MTLFHSSHCSGVSQEQGDVTLKYDSDSEDLTTSSDLQEVSIDGAGGTENLLECF